MQQNESLGTSEIDEVKSLSVSDLLEMLQKSKEKMAALLIGLLSVDDKEEPDGLGR